MTKRPSKYIGTLYAFKFEGREGYGICTNEVIDGWGPRGHVRQGGVICRVA
ncbi:hypothetical protein AB9K37_12345 [Donghicola sp. XS_ASV15]